MPGKISNAWNFTAGSNYAASTPQWGNGNCSPSVTPLNVFKNGTNWSINLWYRISGNTVPSQSIIISTTNNSDGPGIDVWFVNSGSHVNTLFLTEGTGSVGGALFSGYLGNNTIPSDRNWHMLTVIYDGIRVNAYTDKLFEGYINKTTNTPNNNNCNCGLFLGNRPLLDSATLGSLDEVSLWSRILTSQDINVLYNATNAYNMLRGSSTASQAVLTVSPSSGQVGTIVLATGTGYKSSSTITMYWDGATLVTSPRTITTNATGGFKAYFTVPSATIGSHSVLGKDSSGINGLATFTVTGVTTIACFISGTVSFDQASVTPTCNYSGNPPSLTVFNEILVGNGTIVNFINPNIKMYSGISNKLNPVTNLMTTPMNYYMNVTLTDGANFYVSKSNTISLSPAFSSNPIPFVKSFTLTGYVFGSTALFQKPLLTIYSPNNNNVTEMALFNSTNLLIDKLFSPAISIPANTTVSLPYLFNYTVPAGTQNFRVGAIISSCNTPSPCSPNIIISYTNNVTLTFSSTIGGVPISSGQLGHLGTNYTNTNVSPIYFITTKTNNTDTRLSVIYNNGMNVKCNLNYAFAFINRTYGPPLSSVSFTTTQSNSSFLFHKVNNEIITVICTDTLTNNTARDVLTQTTPQFTQQITQFRAGTFGTQGSFGAFDFVVLLVVIFSMIGFNRVNEAVGAFFAIGIDGACAFFGIVRLETFIIGAVIVIAILAYTSTRKKEMYD